MGTPKGSQWATNGQCSRELMLMNRPCVRLGHQSNVDTTLNITFSYPCANNIVLDLNVWTHYLLSMIIMPKM